MIIDTDVLKLRTSRFFTAISDRVLGMPFPGMKRVRQKNVSHCGSASLEMLLSYVGKKATQEKLVANTGSSKKWFEMHGLTVQEMGRSVSKLFPKLDFWYKNADSVKDISKVVNDFKYPVGIGWQGVFEYGEDVDYDSSYGEEDDNPEHYGVVTAINIKKNLMRIADPERHYAGYDRRFPILEFKKRWWDTNDIKVKGSKKFRKVVNKRMMFVVTPKGEIWPKKLGMKK